MRTEHVGIHHLFFRSKVKVEPLAALRASPIAARGTRAVIGCLLPTCSKASRFTKGHPLMDKAPHPLC